MCERPSTQPQNTEVKWFEQLKLEIDELHNTMFLEVDVSAQQSHYASSYLEMPPLPCFSNVQMVLASSSPSPISDTTFPYTIHYDPQPPLSQPPISSFTHPSLPQFAPEHFSNSATASYPAHPVFLPNEVPDPRAALATPPLEYAIPGTSVGSQAHASSSHTLYSNKDIRPAEGLPQSSESSPSHPYYPYTHNFEKPAQISPSVELLQAQHIVPGQSPEHIIQGWQQKRQQQQQEEIHPYTNQQFFDYDSSPSSPSPRYCDPNISATSSEVDAICIFSPLEPSDHHPRPSARLSPLRSPRRLVEKPRLACLFCRGRKIACRSLLPGSPCNQCRRRGLSCKYPSESHRGTRKKKIADINTEPDQPIPASL